MFMIQNGHSDLFIQPSEAPTINQHIFKTYCGMDIKDINFIKTSIENDLHVKKIDFETMLVNFCGLTFFEIFRDNSDLIELLLQQIETQELKNK